MTPRLILFVVCLTMIGACRSETDAPVAVVTVRLDRAQVHPEGPLTLTYRFDASPRVSLAAGCRVVTTFVTASGAEVWTDTHEPPGAADRCFARQTVEYTRLLFAPKLADRGALTVRVSLLDAQRDALPLVGTEDGTRIYTVATLDVKDSPVPPIEYGEGWHDPEGGGVDKETWRWSRGVAKLSLVNPGRDVTLYLDLLGRPDQVGGQQIVSLHIDGRQAASIDLTSSDRRVARLDLDKASLGASPTVGIEVRTTPVFVPSAVDRAQRDTRELGICVYHAVADVR
jgi:hypothetical protein